MSVFTLQPSVGAGAGVGRSPVYHTPPVRFDNPLYCVVPSQPTAASAVSHTMLIGAETHLLIPGHRHPLTITVPLACGPVQPASRPASPPSTQATARE